VRRLLVVCAVTLIVTAFAATQRNPEVSASSTIEQAAAATSVTSPYKVTVIGTGVSPRALASNPSDLPTVLYLTSASKPNQLFTIALSGGGPFAVPNVHMAAAVGTGIAGSLGDGGAAISTQLDLEESSLVVRSSAVVAPDGTIYVADTGNATIRMIAGPASTEPGVIRSIAGRWGPSQGVSLAEPTGLALDKAGNLFIADHAAGAIDLLPANGGKLETLAHVSSPASIAVTPDGATVFVASPEAGAIFSLVTQTKAIAVVPGFTPAASSGTSACAATSAASAPPICPAGLTVDSAGNLYVSDLNAGRILRVNIQTAEVTTVASGLRQPGALATDSAGNLYAAEQGLARIVAFAQVGASQGSISLTPASAAYGNEPSGGATATQSFTLSNISASPVTALSVPKTTSTADFTVQTNNCTATLAANASCTLGIAFTPTTSGARSGTLTVTDANASDSASTVLSGTGDDFQIQLAGTQLSSISVQAGAAATFNLQIMPDSVFSGTVTLVCPTNLPTNTTCSFSSPTVNVTAGSPAPFGVTFQTTGVINPLTSVWPFIRNLPGGRCCFPALLIVNAALLWLVVFKLNAGRGPRGTAVGAQAGRICHGWATLALFLSFAATVMLSGCSKGVSPASIGATPAGTSTMAITGTSQNASRALTITLNVVTK
jgi:sugar lactone lactonase YvrE